MVSETKEVGPVLDAHGHPMTFEDRNRTWSRTPGFTSKARRDLPINGYTDARRKYRQIEGEFWYGNAGVANVFEGYWVYTHGQLLGNHGNNYLSMPAEVTNDSSAYNEALIRALGNVADAKVNVAVALAEARKTSDLILGKANQLYRAYRAFRRLRFREVARILNITPGRVHNTWLEYKYGWMPLLMDVKNAAEFFAQQSLGGRTVEFTASGSAKREAEKTVKTDSSYSPGSYNHSTIKVTRTVKVKIWCRIDNPATNQMQQLGLTNPALYVWETIPFSFVFDWFCSVGDYLTALSSLHGVSVKKAMKSSLTTYDYVYGGVWKQYAAPVQPGLVKRAGSGTVIGSGRTYERSPISIDTSSLYPPTSSKLSFQQMVSGLALLRAQGARLR